MAENDMANESKTNVQKKFHWVDDYMYFTLIDALWIDLKNWMAKGKISEAQWDHIMSRYPG